MYKETKTRSVVKTISWRFWATMTTVALVFFFIGEVEVAFSIGAFEVVIKMVVYFVHERVWHKIRFGRHEVQPFVLWITGLSGSGKRRIAENVAEKLREAEFKTEYLNGETVRDLLNETGFTRAEVNEHIKRVGYLAGKLEKNGVFVVASFLSPYRESRDFVKKLCNNVIEVYVATPLEYCKKEDRRGLYEKAERGEIKHLPGVDVEYEKPEHPDVIVDTSKMSIEEAAETIYQSIKKYL